MTSTKTPIVFHEIADIFPMLPAEELKKLAEDIRVHGLLDPIALFEGKILDGRNRYLACVEAEVEPRYTTVATEDPIAYVLSKNLLRRQLTVGQRASAGVKSKAMYSKRAKERQQEGKGADGSGGRGKKRNLTPNGGEGIDRHANEATAQAAKAVGVGRGSIERVAYAHKHGIPELATALEAGTLAPKTAESIAHAPKEQQANLLAAAQDPSARQTVRPPKAPRHPDCQPASQQGVAILRAEEALDILMRIPKKDPQRYAAFQMITDWIHDNP